MDTETRPMHMLPTRDLLQIYGHIETESQGMDLKKNKKQKTKNSMQTEIKR